MDYIKLFKRYKKMKSLREICIENGIDSGNIDRYKRASIENQEIVATEIKKEVVKMYNFIVFGGDNIDVN